jgi:hypothetical protein
LQQNAKKLNCLSLLVLLFIASDIKNFFLNEKKEKEKKTKQNENKRTKKTFY